MNQAWSRLLNPVGSDQKTCIKTSFCSIIKYLQNTWPIFRTCVEKKLVLSWKCKINRACVSCMHVHDSWHNVLSLKLIIKTIHCSSLIIFFRNNNTPILEYVFKISKPICVLFKWKTFFQVVRRDEVWIPVSRHGKSRWSTRRLLAWASNTFETFPSIVCCDTSPSS